MLSVWCLEADNLFLRPVLGHDNPNMLKTTEDEKKWNVELHPSNAFFASVSYWHVPLGNLRTVWADMDKNNTSMVLYVNFDITILWSLWMTHYLGLQFNRTWFGQCNLHYDMQNST